MATVAPADISHLSQPRMAFDRRPQLRCVPQHEARLRRCHIYYTYISVVVVVVVVVIVVVVVVEVACLGRSYFKIVVLSPSGPKEKP